MTARELIDQLSQVAPDTEVISGVWNGKVDTYTVLDLFLNMPYDSVCADFFGTPGAFDLRMMDIKSPEVVYLGSTFEESDPRVIDDRRFVLRLAAIQRQHRSTQWKKDRIYRLLHEFDKHQLVMKTINIAEILSPDLSFREQARGLRRFVDENYAGEELTVDFSGVRFSSRAFMDEIYGHRAVHTCKYPS